MNSRSADRRNLPASLAGGLAAGLLSGLLLGPGVAVAQGVAALQAQELTIRQQESQLLHRKVAGLRKLDGDKVVAETPPVARVLIVHLWAVECRPCIEEFPVLRPILDSLRPLTQVKAVLVSETADLAKLQGFLRDNRALLPNLPQYQSGDDRLRASLQNSAQPTTLLLDERGIVRQAFLGSIRHRRSELADAVRRLLKSM
jgi:thiol-disulfide isomerase/thioredoxin